jgi:ankyrin repeat protein
MPEIPARPSLEQYKKQAKELVRAVAARNLDALDRIRRWHPRLRKASDDQIAAITLADAQLVLARSHSFPSWPKFAAHLETLQTLRALEDPAGTATLADPVSLFLEFASVEHHGWHGSGTLQQAELIRSRYPHVATASIYTTAVLADEPALRAFLARDPALATAPGGPHQWDALTYLCFSRYLRLDKSRWGSENDAFVTCARLLLDAGADPNTGWMETLDEDPPRQFLESVLYAAAGLARHPGLTQLLLERGADPNDEETCYHAPETYDNTVVKILIDSGRCNERSLSWIAARKADWHDEKGLLLALDGGANPNFMTQWSHTPFQHSIRRDNGLVMIRMFLDHGADPYSRNADGRNAFQMAAYHGRGDILRELESRGFSPNYDPGAPLKPGVGSGGNAGAPLKPGVGSGGNAGAPLKPEVGLGGNAGAPLKPGVPSTPGSGVMGWKPGVGLGGSGLDILVAACALADRPRVRTLLAANPDLQPQLLQIGGSLLARFSGVANLDGVRTLLDLGIPVDSLWPEGDPYFEMPRNSTALQNAAWRAWHDVVRELIARGASVHAADARGRTPLQLAVRACTDSYWSRRRQPDSVAALLAAGAKVEGIKLPTGYDAIDVLLMK